MQKTALAIRHVAFEDLASFAKPLEDAGYTIRYADIGMDPIESWGDPDLLIVLGGPIGVYETNAYPWLVEEIAYIAARLKAKKPTLGICLGAQLMARALSARVYPGRAKEIGWIPLTLTEEGERVLAEFKTHPVLHWHGDTFDLPDGATRLAYTRDCDQQAYALGSYALAFQCHPEAEEKGFERWLIGHTAEISATKNVSVTGLREATREHGAASATRGRAMIGR